MAFATNFGYGYVTSYRIDGNVLSIAKDPACPKVPGDGTFRALNGTVSSGPADNWLSPDGALPLPDLPERLEAGRLRRPAGRLAGRDHQRDHPLPEPAGPDGILIRGSGGAVQARPGALASYRPGGTVMHLTPREFDKLLIYMLAEVALKRKEQGLKLNHPEAVAVISAAALDAARAGKTLEEVMTLASKVLTRDDVMDGVADMIPRVQLEAVFDDGSRLITVHSPIQ